MSESLTSKITRIFLTGFNIACIYCVLARPMPTTLDKYSQPVYRTPYTIQNHLIDSGSVGIGALALVSSVEIAKKSRKD